MPDQTTPNSNSGDASDNSLRSRLKEAGLQADTVVRNAANVATFGLADKMAAAGDGPVRP